MILIWLFFFLMFSSVGNERAFVRQYKNSTNKRQVRYSEGKIWKQWEMNEFDNNWDQYLIELKRLKLHEMKKAIRSKVLSDFIFPYFSLDDIRKRLELLNIYDPQYFDVGYLKNMIGTNTSHRTASGQGILYIKISEPDQTDKDPESNKMKLLRPIIVLVAGIGGSDWIAVQVIMQIVTKLVTSYEDDKLLGFDWWIIPVLNPDGYINSQELRNYRANINPTSGCSGVNLDRNFLSQRDSCDCDKKRINCPENPGKYPFSEIESSALRDFIGSRDNSFQVFVALKEGAKALVYPFASSISAAPGPQTVLQNLLCVEALESFDEMHSGEKGIFEFGNSGNVFGPSSGFVEDWAKRHMGIPRSFAFYVADRSDRYLSPTKIKDYGKGTLKVIQVLATSRRVELYPESIDEIMRNQTIGHAGRSKHRKSRSIPWGRELIDENLRNKIKRGAELEIPIEFMKSAGRKSRFDYFDSGDTE